MDYISFVDIENKKMYFLGKPSHAKFYLPFLAYKFQGNPIVLFGDETHENLEEKYNTKNFGGEYEECLIQDEDIDTDILTDIEMSTAEFNDIFKKIGGKVVTNLENHIRYKYIIEKQHSIGGINEKLI